MINELWQDIAGYKGLYQISDFGRVLCIMRGKEEIIRLERNSKGYFEVELIKKGKSRMIPVHRLVSAAFGSVKNILV